MYTLLHKKIKGKPYSIRHYRGFPKLFLENQALLGFHEAKTGVECGSWANEGVGFWPLVSMGAILGGTMRSPFTGVLFALELTHDVNMLLPLLVAVTIAHG